MVALWLASLQLHDVSIVDPAWGPGFAIVAWIALTVGDGGGARSLLLTVLVSAWAVRLGAHLLARRRSEHREDTRYGALRQRYGERFGLASLRVVFLLQAVLIWAVSLPIQASAALHDPLGTLDWIGAAVCTTGIVCEAVADEQLRRFKRERPDGRILDRGLWRYTRHPNYFGDFLVWWGIGLIALSAGAWWTLVGPLIMSTLLIRVSGKRLLEAHLGDRPGYAEYASRTSGFVPLPPRRRSSR